MILCGLYEILFVTVISACKSVWNYYFFQERRAKGEERGEMWDCGCSIFIIGYSIFEFRLRLPDCVSWQGLRLPDCDSWQGLLEIGGSCLKRRTRLYKTRKINQDKKILKARPPLVTGEVPTGGGVPVRKACLLKVDQFLSVTCRPDFPACKEGADCTKQERSSG